MSDLVERLRSYRPQNEWGDGVEHTICNEASDEIERLRAGIKRLSDEEELCAETTGDDPGGYACSYTGGHCLPGKQCSSRRAHQERMAEILRKQVERPIGIKPGKRITPAGLSALSKEPGE